MKFLVAQVFVLNICICYAQQNCVKYWPGIYKNSENEFEPAVSEGAEDLSELDKDAQIILAFGRRLVVYCYYGFSNPVYTSDTIYQECLAGGFFLFDWLELSCIQANPTRITELQVVAQRANYLSVLDADVFNQAFSCVSEDTGLQIEMLIAQGKWKAIYFMCFNKINKSTSLSKGVLKRGANAAIYAIERPYDRWSEIYGGFLIAKAYTKRQQILNMCTLLDNCGDYWDGYQYLQRGHLFTFSWSDFYQLRNASCFYENNSPEWTTINMGNLQKVEIILAELARSSDSNIIVTTKTLYQQKLSDSNENLISNALLPRADPPVVVVNQLIFKDFFYKTAKYRAIVFNDPFTRDVRLEFQMCYMDMSAQTAWWPNHLFRTQTENDYINGYTYLCFLW